MRAIRELEVRERRLMNENEPAPVTLNEYYNQADARNLSIDRAELCAVIRPHWSLEKSRTMHLEVRWIVVGCLRDEAYA